MATGNLEFGKTLGISAFKSAIKADRIQVIKNPHTDKVFWSSDSGLSGPIFGDWQSIIAALECTDIDTGETFWALTSKEAPSENVLTTL